MFDAAVVADLVRCFWNAVRAQISRGRANDATDVTDGDSNEGRILEVRNPNCDIHVLLVQIQDRIAKSQIDVHFGMTTQKITDDRRHIAPAKQDGSADRQVSPQLRFARDQGFFSLVGGRQNGATTVEIQRTLLGEAEPARGAMEQFRAEMTLQRGEDPNHRRQGGVERVRGGGQAALFDDPYKRFHRPELVHEGLLLHFAE